jgi:hypothetical protein
MMVDKEPHHRILASRPLALSGRILTGLGAFGEPHPRATVTEDQVRQIIQLLQSRGAVFWKALVEPSKGCALALTGKASDAVQMLTSGIAAWRSTGSTAALPMYFSDLAIAYKDNGQFDDARRCIDVPWTTFGN